MGFGYCSWRFLDIPGARGGVRTAFRIDTTQELASKSMANVTRALSRMVWRNRMPYSIATMSPRVNPQPLAARRVMTYIYKM